jgi:hypothetical protein
VDIATLAAGLAAFLGPLLPYLVKGAEQGSETLGKSLGQAGWEKAKAIWGRLRGRLGEDAALKEAAESPEDPDAQAALRVAIRRVLKEDPALARELAALLEQAKAGAGSWVVARGEGAVSAGERGVAIGGSVNGSVIVTGDHDSVQR